MWNCPTILLLTWIIAGSILSVAAETYPEEELFNRQGASSEGFISQQSGGAAAGWGQPAQPQHGVYSYNEDSIAVSDQDYKRYSALAHIGGHEEPNPAIGNAVALAGLGLLFINQVAVALGLPALLPILLVPLTILVLASLVVPANRGSAGGGAMDGLG